MFFVLIKLSLHVKHRIKRQVSNLFIYSDICTVLDIMLTEGIKINETPGPSGLYMPLEVRSLNSVHKGGTGGGRSTALRNKGKIHENIHHRNTNIYTYVINSAVSFMI